MGEWKQCKLKDICKTNASSYSSKDNYSFVNYLDTGNITQNVIDEVQFIDIEKDKLPSRAKRKVKYNSILYSTVRPNQLHYGIIKEQPENFLVSTGFTVIDVDEKMADADFIYYYLTQYEVTESMQAIGEQSTSAYPSIKASDLEDLDICLPTLEEQKKIASFLKSLDAKITINSGINNNLEQQMLSMFQSSFSDLYNSKQSTFESIIQFSNGKKRPNEIGNIPVYGGNGILAYTNKSNAENCIIIGRVGAYCGNVFLSSSCCWVSDNAIQAKSKISDCQLFTYFALKGANLPSRHIGTGQPLMTQGILNSIPFGEPNIADVKLFEDKCLPLQQAIENNIAENTVLLGAMDALLPKLMSGELDLSEIDI